MMTLKTEVKLIKHQGSHMDNSGSLFSNKTYNRSFKKSNRHNKHHIIPSCSGKHQCEECQKWSRKAPILYCKKVHLSEPLFKYEACDRIFIKKGKLKAPK